MNEIHKNGLDDEEKADNDENYYDDYSEYYDEETDKITKSSDKVVVVPRTSTATPTTKGNVKDVKLRPIETTKVRFKHT